MEITSLIFCKTKLIPKILDLNLFSSDLSFNNIRGASFRRLKMLSKLEKI